MRLDKALLVFRKDFQEISRNKEVVLPMVLLPLIIALLIPAIGVMNPESVNIPGGADAMMGNILTNLPEEVQTQLMGYTPNGQVMYVMLVYYFAPFFLIIPVMSSSVIAADSFAGEKEGKTLAALNAALFTSELDGRIAAKIVSARKTVAEKIIANYCIAKGVVVAVNPIPVAEPRMPSMPPGSMPLLSRGNANSPAF